MCGTVSPSEQADYCRLAKNLWIDGQQRYFHKTTNRDKAKLDLSEYIAEGSYIIGVCVAMPLLIFQMFYHYFSHIIYEVLEVMIAFCPGLAATIQGYAYVMALSTQAKQYERMAAIYDFASRVVPQAINSDNIESVQKAMLDLGQRGIARKR